MNSSVTTGRSRWENLDLFLVALCGLVPLFWFSNGELLKSEDLRLPYNWEHWKALFYLWHAGFNTGSELILDNCLMPMMFLPALLQKWGLSILATEKILFVFWFVLPGLSFAYLLRALYRGPHAAVFRIGALSFYLFNLWLENVWIAFKPPLITAYALVPLLLALILRILRGEMRLAVGIPLFFIASFFSSGMGNNSSEFGAAAAPGLLLLGSYFLAGKTWKNKGLFQFLLGRSLLLVGIWLAASAYWFFPQWVAIFRNVVLKTLGQTFNISDMVNWLHGVSQSTSFTNVIRTQADWTWYQGCVDPYRSYSAFYATNRLFYALSWLAPALVFLGIWNKEIRHRGFFIFLTVAGVLLSMGSHPPFGFLYVWMTKHLPLFWIFRSPYLKFYLWVCLGYSVLFGAACHLLYRWLSRLPALGLLVVTILCLSNPIYAFPVTTGRLFHSRAERTFLSPNRFVIPEYVFQAAEWIDKEPGSFRFFTLPGDNPSLYEWGGTNFGSFLKEFSRRPLVFAYHPEQTLVAQGSLNQARDLLNLIREQIYQETTANSLELLSWMQVRYLLHEKDTRYDFYKGPGFFEGDDPRFVEEKMKKQKGWTLDQSFGPWQFYRAQSEVPLIYGANPTETHFLEGAISQLTWWTYQESSKNPPALFLNPPDALLQAIPEATDWRGKLFPTKELPSRIDPESEGNRELYKKVEMAIKNPGEPVIREGVPWIWDGFQIFFTNKSPAPVWINFSFRVFSPEIARSFYLRQGEKILVLTELPADEETDILARQILLPPGKTELNIYSPFRHTDRQGRGVKFAFKKDSFAFGRLTTSIPVDKWAGQKAAIKIYPANLEPLARQKKKILVENKSFVLAASGNSKKAYYEGVIRIPKEATLLKLEQEDPENDFVEITPAKPAAKTETPPPQIRHERVSPTLVKVEVDAPAPFTLVFSESFHPCWEAFTLEEGKKQKFNRNGKVNGFANGYWVDRTGLFTLWLEFTPQKLFRFCLGISFSGLALSFLFLAGALVSSRKKGKEQNEEA